MTDMDTTDSTEAAEAGEAAEAVEAEGTDATESGAGKLGRRATLMAVLAAVAVLFGATAIWSAFEAHRLGNPGRNVALSDEAATHEVRTQIGEGLKAIFSYDYGNLARTRRAADSVLVDGAAARYRRDFADVRSQATSKRTVRTTTVRSLAVESLTGDEARVLAFLDQQTLHTAGEHQESTTAVVAVEARKQGGSWKIARLTSL